MMSMLVFFSFLLLVSFVALVVFALTVDLDAQGHIPPAKKAWADNLYASVLIFFGGTAGCALTEWLA